MSNLVIVPSVPLWDVNGELFFDRKFYDGIHSYCDIWGDTVYVVMRIVDSSPPEFGLVLYDASDFLAKLIIIGKDEPLSCHQLKSADIVLVSGDHHKNLHVSAITKDLGIKCIYIIEYILETRFQIINISGVSHWQKIKSLVWTVLTEVKRRKAFRLADGVQANGVPAYKAYKKSVKNALLYFDSRNSAESYITESELASRLSNLDNNAPLRLGFSGRLISMKGADHLMEMAFILQKEGVPFTFDIFGAGDLVPLMQQKITEYALEETVHLRGNVDFSKELIPFIKNHLDLFVCCHRQSDPSCTYLETYACGIPIIGYANQAHQGILDQVDVGWSVAMNDVNALADKISYLSRNRAEIRNKSINARLFSAEHTFEQTFHRRIEQCKVLVEEE